MSLQERIPFPSATSFLKSYPVPHSSPLRSSHTELTTQSSFCTQLHLGPLDHCSCFSHFDSVWNFLMPLLSFLPGELLFILQNPALISTPL